MGSLSDAIALSDSVKARREYRKRKQEELNQLLASSSPKTRELIVRAIKLVMDLT